jgi:hypothetical protein
MPTYYSPRIVTDGLVLCLDAGNTKSYSGSGTNWGDLSKNVYGSASLVNGVTYTTESNGTLVFDGVNDYWNINTTTPVLDHTVICVAKVTNMNDDWIPIAEFSKTGGTGYFVHYYVQGNTNIYTVQRGGFGANFVTNGAMEETWTSSNLQTVLQDKWYMFTGRVSNNVGDTFLNTNKSKASKSLVAYTQFTPTRLSNVRLSEHFHNGNVSVVLFYNRGLSDLEIEQNYNALKGRFGL